MSELGDATTFDQIWQDREEASYLHWCEGSPQNQIQLAFRLHWETFNTVLTQLGAHGRSLEVGCGRGSLSAYFAKNGWDVTLLDYSQDVLGKAKAAFAHAGIHNATYDCCNCLEMPYEDNTFDCIFSIGLYEHFDNPADVANEQIRCLKPGGILFAYIVPEKVATVQAEYDWINTILQAEKNSGCIAPKKQPIYRTSTSLDDYIKVFDAEKLQILKSSGAYSMPMISHSTDFPFSLLTPSSELVVVERLRQIVAKSVTNDNPTGWLCDEDYGHALLIYGTKK